MSADLDEENTSGPSSDDLLIDIPTETDHRSIGSPRSDQRSYSEEDKALALSVYAETGSCETAAQDTGIPRTTILSWVKRDPDIDAKLDAMRRVLREQMAHRYAVIAFRAAGELLDRVENGNYHVDKEGNVTRRKMPGNELAYVMSVAGDKHALLTGTMQKQKTEDEDLTRLAGKLVQALEARSRSNRATDAEPSVSP